jgi:nucleoside phosphorylase
MSNMVASMSIVFVAAESREFDGILSHVSNISKLRWPVQFAQSAELGGRSVILLANGPGPKLAAEAAEEAIRRLKCVNGFVSTGYCGALDNDLGTLDIVVASNVNGDAAVQPATQQSYAAGPMLSQDSVACTVEEKSRLRETGAIAVEMEAAGVEKVARKIGVPFYCVRVVTDAASESLALDFNRVRDADGRFSVARILAAALRRPGRVFPELFRLERTCRSASVALGDFIANCRF